MNRHTLDGLTATDRTETSTPRLKFKATEAADGAGVKVHYLENKCTSEEPRKFCDFRQLINLSLKTVDSLQSSVDSLGECRELCLAAIECRSYLYDATLRVCRLSHLTELSTWHINQPYEEIEGVSTYEISTCYNVSILCEPKSMKVQIETSKLFSGRIYSKSQPKQCVNDVSNQMDFHLSLPYIDADEETMRGKRCDTRQNFPGSFANDIIIQHNDKVLTSKDLSLGVYCKFDLQNDSIARIDLRIQGEILTDKLKGAAELPDLSLHVVDYHGRDIDEVTIGDLLRVQIRMSNEETYGIFVRNLVAKDSSNKTNNITLIDNKG
ncbi:PREDICTED: uncharacterized protein LOC108354892, partial [Rhagoletis zephyria]|uniref:uncharacterized protein LOC108354892 n=1 Tax=Rhagoletis zephyria TaxID=28612 RepID=UPI000811A5DD